jgi:hypothetical protein
MSQQESPDQDEQDSQTEPADPEDNFIQAMIALALVACLFTITLVSLELNREFGVEFGGILSAPEQTSQTSG